jgi:hypothetical protein
MHPGDLSGYGEDRIPGARTTATINANGTFSCLSSVLQAGQVVSVTATNTSGTASGTSIGYTTEFARNVGVISVP